MSKIARATQQLFGSTGGAGNFSEYGSLAANSPATYSSSTITPAIIQGLSNFLQGWFGGVVGENAPAIEDMNSLFYLIFYQLCYLMQEGIAEWDSGTTYYSGSLAQDGTGLIYVSLQNTNLNNALSSTAWWRPQSNNQVVTLNPSTQSPYTMTLADNGKVFLVTSANAAMQFNLPAPTANFYFTVKDQSGNFGTNNCTMHRQAAESIETVASDYIMMAGFGEWTFDTDGTNWYIGGR